MKKSEKKQNHGKPQLSTGSTLKEPKNMFVLNVQLIPQQTNMWCWAASGQMVMNYAGVDITQCEQANDRFGLNNCCTIPTPTNCIHGGSPNYQRWGFNSEITPPGQALSFQDLIIQLDSNMPVSYSWRWNGGGGHVMVAIGYSAQLQMVRINNPAPPNIGDTKWISYRVYVQGNNHHHGRDNYNITKDTGLKSHHSPNKIPLNNMESYVFSTPKEAVNDGLERYFSLVNNTNYKEMGLEKIPNDANSIKSDEYYLKIYFIRHDDLLNFNEKSSPLPLLIDINERMYPIFYESNVVSAITIQQDKNEKWEVKSIGDLQLIQEIIALREKLQPKNSKYFIITIPSLYHVFLACLDDENKLKLIEIHSHDIQSSTIQMKDASEIFSVIKAEAMNNKSLNDNE